MFISTPPLAPPFHIVRLSHVVLGVRNLAASRRFYVEILGLQVTDEDAQHLYLRALEERGHHSVVLLQSEQADARCLAFKVHAETDLDAAAAWFSGLGLPVSWVSRPYQGRTLCTRDCDGMPLEFYARMDRLPPIHQNYALYSGARPLRIDHCNCFVPDVARSLAFYQALGFRLTEYTEDEASGGLWAVWLHRKGGVHDISFTNGPGPRLHHIALWVPSPMAVIDLCDLMATSGHVSNIERGPGRHGISNAFFLYVTDPDGHRIELYCSDYQTIDPDHEPIRWALHDPQRQTLWGAPAPESWFKNGTPFQEIDIRAPVLNATPIVAP